MTELNYDFNTEMSDVLNNMVEINFVDSVEDGFRKVKETLQRMGVASNKDKVLYQSAHIFHKRGRYYICHFKELFALDGKSAIIGEHDLGRRNLIIKLLMDWDLIKPITNNYQSPISNINQLKILKYDESQTWESVAKYSIGNNHNNIN